MYDANHRRIELDVNYRGPPWWGVWLAHLLLAIIKSGGDVEAANHLHEWILDNPMFEDVVHRDFWIPVVPAPRDTSNDSEEARQLDKKLSDDCYVRVASIVFLSALTFMYQAFLRSGRPLILGYGFAPETVSMIEEKALEELRERKFIQFTRLQCVYARKRQPQS